MKPPRPHYRHINNVPEGLASRVELNREGLDPGGPPVATVSHGSGSRGRQPTLLYDRREAIPRRHNEKLQEMQLATEIRKEQRQEARASTQVHDWQTSVLQDLRTLAALPPEQWVTLDTETTDLIGEAISISVVSGHGKVLFDRLLRPSTPISPAAFKVHQISMSMLEHQPTFLEVYPELQRALHGKTILAYNADFDRGTLQRTQKRLGVSRKELAFPQEAWHCLMQDVAALFGKPSFNEQGNLQEFRALSLTRARDTLARTLRRPLEPFAAHSSLEDAQATRELALLLFEYARLEQAAMLPEPLEGVSPYTLRPPSSGRRRH